MSVSFSAGYDAIVARLAVLLPLASGYNRLPYAVDLHKNPDLFLKKGWAFGLSEGGDNTSRLLGAVTTTNLNYTIALTRYNPALELDPVKKSVNEKLLLEDLRAVLVDIWSNNFNMASPIIKFVGFTGIQPVRTDNDSYIAMVMKLNVEYFI